MLHGSLLVAAEEHAHARSSCILMQGPGKSNTSAAQTWHRLEVD